MTISMDSERDTGDAITKFVDVIEKELTSNKHVCSIYIDVSKLLKPSIAAITKLCYKNYKE